MNRIKVPGPFKYRELPADVVYVGRGVWGYPASVYANPHTTSAKGCKLCDGRVHTHAEAVDLYLAHLRRNPDLIAQARRELAGKTLACWCGLDEACHADALAKLVEATTRMSVSDDDLGRLLGALFAAAEARVAS